MTATTSLATWLKQVLNKPLKVIGYTFCLSSLYILANGNLHRIVELRKDKERIQADIKLLQNQVLEMKQTTKNAKDPRRAEREALERFDLAGEDDLIFVFSN
jgi:peptidoglycan hydrolase CwlO-like protein